MSRHLKGYKILGTVIPEPYEFSADTGLELENVGRVGEESVGQGQFRNIIKTKGFAKDVGRRQVAQRAKRWMEVRQTDGQGKRN